MSIVEYALQDGDTVLVRISDGQAQGPVTTRGASTSAVIERAEGTFESVMNAVRTVTRGVAVQVQDFVQRPDVLAVEFGIELTAQAGAVITTAGASAHLKVSLTWNTSRPGSADQPSSS
ncbi:CU044_2847 family protein [Streptomyces sp. N2A]|uniref:CU044_2847 family protein n=1 Tax=Streptomyces sp. N2A TaxID=3073936 RepID=UPI00286FCAAE|nr:CU044_2847 family protein [Streptomyces sp. N2A]